ncbi:hypothetical protein F5887DRAFT_923495 [Amanita rubescens]|nr:hypothetical protein F5887DRAFT_923495 [Amanita rubescens]
MLFLYSLLFFVLGTSVVALPVSPLTVHLSRRGPNELNGYWHSTGVARVIYIENNHILEASPKFSKNTDMDLYHATSWRRATKSSVAALNLPPATLANIPNTVEPVQANERLMIGDLKDGQYPSWLDNKSSSELKPPTHHLSMAPNAIIQDKKTSSQSGVADKHGRIEDWVLKKSG